MLLQWNLSKPNLLVTNFYVRNRQLFAVLEMKIWNAGPNQILEFIMSGCGRVV